MADEKKIISWISKRPVRFESQRFEPVCHYLTQHGYEIRWIDAPGSFEDLNIQNWLAERLSPVSRAVFYGDKDLDVIRPIVKAIRGLQNSPLSFQPFFWLYEDTDHHLIEKLGEVGFDDFCHSVKPNELLFRLHLRDREMDTRIKTDQQLKDHSIRLAKNETILKQREEFLGVCAHDLRSPIGLIQSSASMILNANGGERTGLSPMQHELITRIKRQAGEALGLVKDLLDVTSLEQGLQPQYQLLSLHDIIYQFYADYRQQAETKEIRFEYDNGIKDWRILADADRIKQLLQNLFTNALKFTDAKKSIQLSVMPFKGRRKSDPPYPMVVISVKDEGKGIPPKEMQKIFDRFTQLKDRSKADGRGLGLTVAKQISTLHEGNIWLESEEGKGSTFHVLFPHVVSRTQRDPETSDPRPVTVLVAEPSTERRDVYFQDLTSWGVQVHYAKDGVEALAMLFHLLPDVLILTTNLAKMDIPEVMDIVKSDVLTSTIPVFLAAEESEKVENKIETHIFDRVIKMPFSRDLFEVTLKSVGKLRTATPAPTSKKKAA